MPKNPAKPIHRHGLADDITNPWNNGVRVKSRGKKRRVEEDDRFDSEVVTENLSRKILREADAQQKEVDAEEAGETAAVLGSVVDLTGRGIVSAAKKTTDSDEDTDDDDGYSDTASQWDAEEIEVTAEDEAALEKFMRPNAESTRTLADVIMQKIREKQEAAGVDTGPAIPGGLDPKVVQVYQGVGKLMSRYTSGKVPKALKILPRLNNWEEILYITEPDNWSVHACFQATRIFISSLNAKMAQRFLALVLLPRVRHDIRENKRLHFALFQAMKKAVYKPGAFYKGLLLPLCKAGDCTLREAVIVAAVLKRVSIPVLHSAAALMRIAEMEYSGINSFFILQLIEKKYALPYRTIDALVDHFCRFESDERQMHVIWHQSLLAFVQRYKNEIRREDKEALRHLCKRQQHHMVTPEVLRELDHGRNRGEKGEGPVSMEVQYKTGQAFGEDPNNLPPVLMLEDDL